jgi:cell division protein ZapA (FtsZ GTPase activity inhibitor)
MPKVEITIGGHAFNISYKRSEEAYLKEAVDEFDRAVKVFGEARSCKYMLLMGGLYLADKLNGVNSELADLKNLILNTSKDLNSKSDTFYGTDKRSAEDYKLWAKIDDPNASDSERRAALEKVFSREAQRREGKSGNVDLLDSLLKLAP